MRRYGRILTVISELCKGGAKSSNQIGFALVKAELVQKPFGKVSNYCICATAILNSLKRSGLVGYFHSSKDQWAVKLWFVTEKGKARIVEDAA